MAFAHINLVYYAVLVSHVNAIQPSDHLIMDLFYLSIVKFNDFSIIQPIELVTVAAVI